ncbi:MAG: MFS transporter [Aggregatilineales bacterium]
MSQTSRAYRYRWFGLLFIGLAVLTISMDNTILNAALPSIAQQLGANTAELQWIVDVYVLIFAALLLSAGAIGDRFGRKKTLQIGLVWFAVDSIVSANAQSTGMLTLSRALVGVGGALILPATLSIVSATFHDKERPQAISIWATIFGAGIGLGPVLGGFLLEHFAWNSVFWINVPVCAVAFIGGTLLCGESKDAHPRPLDIPGVVLSIVGLFVLIYGIIEAGVRGWTDSLVLLSLGAGILILTVFAIWEARAPNPMLPIRFFKNPSFSVASLTLALVLFTQFGFFFFGSPYLQTIRGYSTFIAGLLLLPFPTTMTGMAALSPRLMRWLGIKRAVAFGVGIAAIAALYMALVFRPDTPYVAIAFGEFLLGLGIGSAFSPATNSIMGAVPINNAGVGLAMNDTNRQVGGAFGVAAMGTVLNLGYVSSISALKDSPNLAGLPAATFAQIVSSVQSAHVVANTLPPAMAQAVIDAANQSFIVGLSHGFLVGAGALAAAFILVLTFLPAVPHRSAETPIPVAVLGRDGSAQIESTATVPLPGAKGLVR